MRMRAIRLAAAILPAFCAGARDWPMLAANPQRTNRTDEELAAPYFLQWEARFEPERVSRLCQFIVAGGRGFIGTKSGHLHALDARTGARLWTYAAGGAIVHTAGFDNGRVFAGCLNGAVHAIAADSGELAWVFHAPCAGGFSASVLPVANKVFIGSRRGVFYALNQADGSLDWSADFGAPIFFTAAFDDNRVYVGAEDMRVRCLDAGTGEPIWISERLYGQGLRHYHPVIAAGKVLVTVATSESGILDHGLFAWAGNDEFNAQLCEGVMPDGLMEEQERIRDTLRASPQRQSLFVLDEATGRQAYIAPVARGVSMGTGPNFPPAIDCDGLALVTTPSLSGAMSRTGRLDLETGLIVDILAGKKMSWYDPNYNKFFSRVWNPRGDNLDRRLAGGASTDEKLDVSAAGFLIFLVHPQEENAAFTGTFDLRSREWTMLPAGGKTPFWSNALTENNAISIADGMFFHNCYGRVRGWRATRPAAAQEEGD